MMNALYYPAGLPEKCQTCPTMREDILRWNMLQTMTDDILESNLNQSRESIAGSLCEAAMAVIAQASDEPLNPGINADRLRAAELLQTNNGQAFEVFSEVSQGLEASMKLASEICEGRGPLKLRVAEAGGSIVVAVCRGHIAAAKAEPGEVMIGQADVRSEAGNN